MIHSATPRSKTLAVFGLLLALFLVALDQTVVGTAMPRIIAELRGFEVYAWVTTVYLLTETAVIPIAGKLGDMYGRKWIVLGGVIIFLLSSWLCGFASDIYWLIIARGVQGIGAGAIFATVFTLIADVIPDPAERAKYQGLFFAVFALASVVGPIVGGFITDTLGWRWVFYVNVPIGLLALGVLPFVLPPTVRNPNGKIDWLGAVVSTIGVVALLLAFTWIGAGQAWTAPEVVAGLMIFLIALALFIPIEQRAHDPIIPLSLFKNRTVSSVTVMMFLSSIAMFGIILYTPLYLQGVAGESASISGAVLIPLVLTMTLVSVVGGQLVSRIGRIRPFLIFGAFAVTLGAFLFTTLGTTPNLFVMAGFMFIVGVGLGLLLPNSTLAVQTTVEQRNIGVATSSTQFIRSIGATVGTALMGTVVAAGFTRAMAAGAPQGATPEVLNAIKSPDALVSPEALRVLTEATNALPNGEQLLHALLDTARYALAVGIHNGFWMLTIASALAVVAAFMIPHLDFKKRDLNSPNPAVVMEGQPAAGPME